VKISQTLGRVALAVGAMRAGAQGSIAGTVYDSLSTRAPLANATVVLVERSQYATTDARGRFRIDSVPDGHYTLGFMHPVLDALDLEAPVVTVNIAGGRRAAVALFTPSPAAAYARICPGAREPETGVLIGQVRDVDDKSPLAGATVSTEWTEYTLGAGHATGHRARAATRTNDKGIYLLCGVPAATLLDVHTELGGFIAGPTPLLLSDRLISRVDFAVSRRDSAARAVSLGDSSTSAAGSPGTASLRGVVLGGDGRALRDAVVGVVGTPRSAHTDAAGAFRIDHVPAGTRTIEVRSIGPLPMTVSMDFATNAVRDTTLSISRQAQALKPVTVKGQSKSLLVDDGFDTRRAHGLGAYVTETDIAKHNFPDLVSVLIGVRGVHVEFGTHGHPIPYLKGINDFKSAGANCTPNFFVDGTPFAAGFSDLNADSRPELIRGIEVYSNPGAIPAQYDLTSSTGCGSIVIWMK
jgi:hypothetical protein